ncbi:MAG: YggU family protein [Candidatus Diapherotrites archaeon]|jgi:uncharacterized protein|nr:YggU family protein [Candidatus Diapherotrites archaeon]MBT4596382.1 YggU family protein [Candidatus Diapherotrites archaeon]
MKTRLKLKISTGKQEFHTEWDDLNERLLVEITSNPQKGQANKEVLKELKKFFNREIELISGFKSKEKIVEINASKEEVFEKIKQN